MVNKTPHINSWLAFGGLAVTVLAGFWGLAVRTLAGLGCLVENEPFDAFYVWFCGGSASADLFGASLVLLPVGLALTQVIRGVRESRLMPLGLATAVAFVTPLAALYFAEAIAR